MTTYAARDLFLYVKGRLITAQSFSLVLSDNGITIKLPSGTEVTDYDLDTAIKVANHVLTEAGKVEAP
jgi:hypothetical protein